MPLAKTHHFKRRCTMQGPQVVAFSAIVALHTDANLQHIYSYYLYSSLGQFRQLSFSF